VGGDMPRARNPNRDKAKKLYLEYKGKIDLIEIAKKLDVPPGTIRGWKYKDKWDSELNGTFQTNHKKRSKRKPTKDPPKKEPVYLVELESLENAHLTDKQRLFCIYYVKYFNATKSYQKAYDCKYETALAAGPRLLGNVRVEQEIERLKASKLKGAYLGKEDILQKYIDIAFADITDFIEFGSKEITLKDEDGRQYKTVLNYVGVKDSAEVDGTIISEVKKGRSGTSIKLHDKMKALEFLAKHIGLLDIATQEKIKREQEIVELRKQELELKQW
jgi:phage terminase small subunit